MSLAKNSYERLSKEHSSLNDFLASSKNEQSLVQESLTSLKDKYHHLELNYDVLWKSTSTPPKESDDSKSSTSQGCKRCYNVDINACATNLDELDKKIWARGTCTARIHDHHQAIGPAAIKGRPARADMVDQCGEQGKPRQAYLDDS